MTVPDRNEGYEAKYTVDRADGGYRFTFFCSMCDWSYTTGLITAGSADDAKVVAEKEARLYFNGCKNCRRWLCDDHYNMDEMACVECAPRTGQKAGNTTGQTEKTNHTRRVLTLAACFAFVVAGIGTFIAINNRPDRISFQDDPVPLAGFMQFDEAAKPYSGTLPENLTVDSVKIPVYASVVIPAGTTDVQMLLLNPEGNEYNFSFELILSDADETLYRSELVRPGWCIDNISLARGLPKGEYKAKRIILMYAPEGLTAANSTTVGFDLIVEEQDGG